MKKMTTWQKVCVTVMMAFVVTAILAFRAHTAHATFCEYEYQYVYGPYGWVWQYVWVCY